MKRLSLAAVPKAPHFESLNWGKYLEECPVTKMYNGRKVLILGIPPDAIDVSQAAHRRLLRVVQAIIRTSPVYRSSLRECVLDELEGEAYLMTLLMLHDLNQGKKLDTFEKMVKAVEDYELHSHPLTEKQMKALIKLGGPYKLKGDQ